jgi:hypothetical protein
MLAHQLEACSHQADLLSLSHFACRRHLLGSKAERAVTRPELRQITM